jgi:hypothetical protein
LLLTGWLQKRWLKTPANYEVFKQGALDTNVFGLAIHGAVAELKEDGRTVRLTLNTAQFLNNNTIANRVVVKKAVGLSADYTNNNVALKDETVPTFQSVRSIGTRTLELTFSEPVRTYPLQWPFYQIENVVLHDGVGFVGLALLDATYTPSKNQVLINSTVDLIPGRTYTLTLSPTHNLHDYVGLKVVPTSRTFTHAQVTSTPAVSAVAVTDRTLRLVFDRAVSLTTAGENVEFRYGFNASTANKATSANMNNAFPNISFAAAAVPGTGNREYFITLASPMTEGAGLLYIHYLNNSTAAGRIVDGFGNVVPNNTMISFTVGPVSERPTVISTVIAQVNPIIIEVTFSEPVDGADDVDNYSLRNRFNEVVTFVLPYLKTGTTTTYVIEIDENAVGLPFTLNVSDNIRDKSVAANRLIPYSVLLEDPMIAAPYIIGARTVGFNQIALTYSREVTVPNNATSRSQFNILIGLNDYTPISISYSGSVVTLTLPPLVLPATHFTPGTAYPSTSHIIKYKQVEPPPVGIGVNRVRAAFPVAFFEHAVSPDEFRGISSGF